MYSNYENRETTLNEDEIFKNEEETVKKLGYLNLEAGSISNTSEVLNRTKSLMCCSEIEPSGHISLFESDKRIENIQEHLHHTVHEYRAIQRKEYKMRPSISSSTFNVKEVEITEMDDELKLVKMLEKNLFLQEIIIYQTAKALKCCRASADFRFSRQLAEYERLLLLSTCRYNGISEKLKFLKHEELSESPIERGSVDIFNLSLNLKNSMFLVNEDKLEKWFVILLRCDDNIQASSLCSVLKDQNPLKITETFTFNNLLNKFAITIQLYCLELKQNKKVFKQNFKRHKKVLHEVHSESTTNVSTTSEFQLKGSFNLNLDNLRPVSHVEFVSGIIMEFCSSWNIESRVNVGGFLGIAKDIGEYKVWDRKWCSLEECFLKYWNYPSDKAFQTPLESIDLRHCTVVQTLDEEVSPLRRTFILEEINLSFEKTNKSLESDRRPMIKHFFCADSLKEMSEWCFILNRHIELLQKWKVGIQI